MKVGKSSLKRIVGDGTSRKVDLLRAGQVLHTNESDKSLFTHSRESGQPEVQADTLTPINKR